MAAQRCSSCGINYPIQIAVCRLCDQPLSYMGTAAADRDWEDHVQRARAAERFRRNEHERIVAWRLEQLIEAGYDVETAEILAGRWYGRDQIDLHQALELVAAGCPPDTAAAILL